MLVHIKYSNRENVRFFEVSGEFNEIKEFVKANGGKFDGTKKSWSVGKELLAQIKEKFGTVNADFFPVDIFHNKHQVCFRAYSSLVPFSANGDLDELQAAYNKSDDELIRYLEAKKTYERTGIFTAEIKEKIQLALKGN